MAYTLKQFFEAMKDPERNFGARRCHQCNNILDALDLQEPHYLSKHEVCSDCYFGAWGKEIERHPIHRPTGKKTIKKKRIVKKKKQIGKLDFIFKKE